MRAARSAAAVAACAALLVAPAAKRSAAIQVAQAAAAAPAALADSRCAGDPGRTTDDVDNDMSTLPDVKVVYAAGPAASA
jgi:hypothetical protein